VLPTKVLVLHRERDDLLARAAALEEHLRVAKLESEDAPRLRRRLRNKSDELLVANRAARPEGYAGGSAYGSTLASRLMPLSGLVVLAFIVYHLLHFTALQPGINGVGDFSKLQTTLHGETVPDVYATMVLGFRVWWVALAYLIAQGLLFLHLSHGLSAMFQSLGLRNHVWWPRIRAFAAVASALIFLGYASIPVAVLAGGLGQQHVEKAKAQLGLAAAGKEVVR
jgi:succinate dehydrogenase/fumarate reductase cytochrome b subunit (b558 family)